MDIKDKIIWQQASGDTNRNYSAYCLKWGVILNGPGCFGKWPDCERDLLSDRSGRKATDIRRFAEEIKPGHLVVLRLGTGLVLAVGEIIGGYEWNDEFGDVDGWDLQHVRRVRWLWKGEQLFPTYSLKMGDTTQRINNGPITRWLSELSIAEGKRSEPLVTLPPANGQGGISIVEVSELLFNKGVASGSIRNLLNEAGELTRIAAWYKRSAKPSEHETVAYLVVPLLRALGWPPQRLAVEWNRIDVALFDRLPRKDESIRGVVEAKKLDDACLTALHQARGYVRPEYNSCDRVILTDGIRYGVYVSGGDIDFKLHGYLNLLRLRRNYPIYGCGGAEAALLAMSPEWRGTSDGECFKKIEESDAKDLVNGSGFPSDAGSVNNE